MRTRRTGWTGPALLIGRCVVLAGCTSGPLSGPPTYFQPSRISVQDLRVDPAVPTPGSPARVTFRLVRAGDDGSPVYWTGHLVERPSAGGSLSALSGGPLPSGALVEVTYTPAGRTAAFLSIYPSSTPGTTIGDGSGDWRSLTVEVR